LVEALAADVYGLPKQAFLSGGFPDLDSELVSSTLDFIASNPRSQQMLDKDSQVVQALNLTISKYLGSKEVKRQLFKADPREPEWVVYDSAQLVMQAFNVKPAIFDLILAICIALYLVTIYAFVSNFHYLKFAIQPVIYHSATNGFNGKASSPLRNGHAKKL